MGFWSTLGKIAIPAAGIAAAPFTGGASLLGTLGSVGGNIAKGINAASPMLGALGSVASGAAKGSADQRMSEYIMALQRGRMGTDAARDQFSSDLAGANSQFNADLAGSNAQFGAGMQGAQFGREGQTREQRQALLSSLLGNMKDVKHTPGNPRIAAAMSQNTGGARPSNLTNNKDALMALLGQAQIQAPTYNAPSAFKAPAPYKPPTLPTMPQAGGLEKGLGGVGLVTSILGALGKPKPQVVK